MKASLFNVDPATLSLTDNIIESSGFSAHVKDVRTGLYLNSNDTNAKQLGFHSSDEIIGLTFEAVNSLLLDFWGSDLKADIEKIEYEVVLKKTVIQDRRIFINSDMALISHEMKKMPVVGVTGRVCGILTISDNVVNRMKPVDILNAYKTLRPDDYITLFLNFMGVSKYIYIIPTHHELLVLLAKSECSNTKEIALFLGVSEKTVSWYISSLHQKVSINKIIEVIKKRKYYE